MADCRDSDREISANAELGEASSRSPLGESHTSRRGVHE